MRSGILLALALLLCSDAFAADEPGLSVAPADDPALGNDSPPSGSSVLSRLFAPRPRGSWLKFGYRTFAVTDHGGDSARYHCFTVDFHYYSRYLRGGVGLEGGAEDTARNNYVGFGVLSGGVQYPARVTPYLDFIFGAGVLRRDVLHQDLVDFAYNVGLETGLDVFFGPGLLISTTMGWRRQVFSYGGHDQVDSAAVYFDTFTARVGFGF